MIIVLLSWGQVGVSLTMLLNILHGTGSFFFKVPIPLSLEALDFPNLNVFVFGALFLRFLGGG